METCKICKESFKNLKGLSTHVNSKHKLTGKQYYDEYLKREGEGQCIVCSGETSYRNIGVGYLDNCSMECRNNSKDYRRKQSESKKGKTQSKQQIEKRVKNTNQADKEKKRKQTMLDKYGEDNPSKLDSIKKILSEKNKGKILVRTDKWQNNIIESKRKNGTLKHTDKTKKKISDKLNNFYSLNLDREKYISKCNNVNHLSGWYNGLYFRSSLELSFLFHNKHKNFLSCETNNYKVIYDDNGKKRCYYPDFTDGEFIYEVKPSGLLSTYINKLKIQEGIKVYGDKYNIITEVESPYITKSLILDLIKCGVIKLTKKADIVLKKYRF